jgi:hypothetical protein
MKVTTDEKLDVAYVKLRRGKVEKLLSYALDFFLI